MSDMDQKLDKILGDISEIKISQAKTEVIMDEHIKRTALNEENMFLLRKEFKPIKSHVDFMNNLAKITAIAGAILLFVQQMGWLDNLFKLLHP